MSKLKLMVPALSMVIGFALLAYAGNEKVPLNGADLAVEFGVQCSQPGKICVTAKPSKGSDDLLGVGITCEGGGDHDEAVAKKPGKKAKACVKCAGDVAVGAIVCADDNESACNDDFTAIFKCKGEVDNVSITGNVK